MPNEHSFVKAVHRLLPPEIYVWKISAQYVRGVPDAWYSGVEGDLFVEYKWMNRTPKRRFTPKIRPNQAKWLRDRCREGRNVAVVIGTPDGAVVLTEHQWETTMEIPQQWLSKKEVAKWIETQTLSG
jgi:hypothetical protein